MIRSLHSGPRCVALSGHQVAPHVNPMCREAPPVSRLEDTPNTHTSSSSLLSSLELRDTKVDAP